MNSKAVPPQIPILKNVYPNIGLRMATALMVAVFISGYHKELIGVLADGPRFYRDFLIALFLAMAVIEWIHFISKMLDKTLPWSKPSGKRLFLQINFGIVIPCLFEVALALFFFQMEGTGYLKEIFINFTFPSVFLMIVLYNVFYAAIYLYNLWARESSPRASLHSQDLPVPITSRDIFVLRGDRMHIVSYGDVLYAYRHSKHNYIKTNPDGLTYIVWISLEEIDKTLAGKCYFRLNRQLISHRSCCTDFTVLRNNQIRVVLRPSSPIGKNATVSQKRALAFKEWMGSGSASEIPE